MDVFFVASVIFSWGYEGFKSQLRIYCRNGKTSEKMLRISHSSGCLRVQDLTMG